MIFNSLFNLIETDTDGVYKFICKVFLETNSELCIEDSLYLFAMIKKSKEEKDYEHFIKLFENKKKLLKVLNQIIDEGKFSFFTTGKDVKFSELSEDGLNLVYNYINFFGLSNIKNPDKNLCEKLN